MLSASSISTRRERWRQHAYTKYNTVKEDRTDTIALGYIRVSRFYPTCFTIPMTCAKRARERERILGSLVSLARLPCASYSFPSSRGSDVGFSVVTVATHPDDKLGEFATPVLATPTCRADGKPKQNRRGINMRTP